MLLLLWIFGSATLFADFFYVDCKIYPIIFNPKPETFHLNFLSFGFCGFQIISTSDDILMQFFASPTQASAKNKVLEMLKIDVFIFLMSKLVKCLVVPIQILKRKDLVALKLHILMKIECWCKMITIICFFRPHCNL